MLVLSILIILALAVAVASFFITDAQWLLFISAGLVLLAFYLSRRTSNGIAEPDTGNSARTRKPGEHLSVVVDEQSFDSGQHHEPAPIESDDPDASGCANERSESRRNNGRAVAS
jgi:membrane protein implicated in regulation of membrane protease activity